MQTSLAIVILNYNGAHFLEQFLPSVIQHSTGHRIIVADNASTDASVAILQQKFAEVEILQLPENTGYAGGYNEALKQIDATYYLLLNSDVAVSKGWLEPMLALMDAHPNMAACQPKIRSYHQPAFFEYAGAAGGYLDLLGYPFCRGRIFDTLEKDQGQYDEVVPIFWASGACMMLRADSFHDLGGFDAGFFAHMEEIDLCWRIHLAGQQVYACPQSIVYHVGGGTLPKSNPRKTFLNFRNGLWMLYKNSSPAVLGWKLGIRLLLDYLAALQFLRKGEFRNTWAILKAHLHVLLYLPRNSRKKVQQIISGQQSTSRQQKLPFYNGYIIWDYYVKGRKESRKLENSKPQIFKIQKSL